MTTDQFLEVPISQVNYSRAFNSRVTYERVKELAADIETNGMINPVIVYPYVGPDKSKIYQLAAGHRRAMAIDSLRKAGAPEPKIKILVREAPKNEQEAFLLNVAENMARDELTTFEVAQVLVRLREQFNMDDESIQRVMAASKGGYSKKHIANLVRAAKKLHPKILEAWKAEHPVCSLLNLLNWASLEHDEQLEAFDDAAANRAAKGEGKEDGASADGDKSAKPKRTLNRDQIELALISVRQAMKDKVPGADIAESVLCFVLRRKGYETLTVGKATLWDPEEEAREAAQEAALAKAEKEAAKAKEKEEAAKAKAIAVQAEAKAKAEELLKAAAAKAKAIASGEVTKKAKAKAKPGAEAKAN